MPDPWMLMAVVEAGAIAGYLAAPVVRASHEALQSMGTALEQDVQDENQ